MHCRRNDIIAGLTHVHMIVRMDRLLVAYLAAERLDRSIRDDLIGIHVGGSTRSGLENIDDKMLIEFSIGSFSSRVHDRVADAFIQEPKIHIGASGGELNQTDSADKFSGEAKIADGKILNSTLSLSSIKRIGRNRDFSHRIALDPLISVFSNDKVHKKKPDPETEYLPPLNIDAGSMHVRPASVSCRRRRRRGAMEILPGIRASPLQPAAGQCRRCD